MAKEKTTLVVVIEYKIELPDGRIARFMADLAEKHGAGLGSDGYSLWEWSPAEKVISAEVI